MSSVFRAHDHQLEREVAIKILHQHYAEDPEYVERFRREARAVARLSHPNIVTVIDRGDDDGRQFIVFEHVEGENLKELVLRTGRLPVPQALELVAPHRGRALVRARARARPPGREAAERASQQRGRGQGDRLRHRALAPHGSRRHADRDGARHRRVPRARAGEREAGLARDRRLLPRRRALELLAGDVPFVGENFVAVALRHVNEPPPSLRERRPDVSPRLDAAVQRALAKDPARRFPSMAAFAQRAARVPRRPGRADTGAGGRSRAHARHADTCSGAGTRPAAAGPLSP